MKDDSVVGKYVLVYDLGYDGMGVQYFDTFEEAMKEASSYPDECTGYPVPVVVAKVVVKFEGDV